MCPNGPVSRSPHSGTTSVNSSSNPRERPAANVATTATCCVGSPSSDLLNTSASASRRSSRPLRRCPGHVHRRPPTGGVCPNRGGPAWTIASRNWNGCGTVSTAASAAAACRCGSASCPTPTTWPRHWGPAPSGCSRSIEPDEVLELPERGEEDRHLALEELVNDLVRPAQSGTESDQQFECDRRCRLLESHELVPRQHQEVHVGQGVHGGGALPTVEERHLSEEGAGSVAVELPAVPRGYGSAFDDHEELVAGLALASQEGPLFRLDRRGQRPDPPQLVPGARGEQFDAVQERSLLILVDPKCDHEHPFR